jgi:hypothetical protein
MHFTKQMSAGSKCHDFVVTLFDEPRFVVPISSRGYHWAGSSHELWRSISRPCFDFLTWPRLWRASCTWHTGKPSTTQRHAAAVATEPLSGSVRRSVDRVPPTPVAPWHRAWPSPISVLSASPSGACSSLPTARIGRPRRAAPDSARCSAAIARAFNLSLREILVRLLTALKLAAIDVNGRFRQPSLLETEDV